MLHAGLDGGDSISDTPGPPITTVQEQNEPSTATQPSTARSRVSVATAPAATPATSPAASQTPTQALSAADRQAQPSRALHAALHADDHTENDDVPSAPQAPSQLKSVAGHQPQPNRALHDLPPAGPEIIADKVDNGKSRADVITADPSSGDAYLDAIMHGSGMVRLPSLTPSRASTRASASGQTSRMSSRTPSPTPSVTLQQPTHKSRRPQPIMQASSIHAAHATASNPPSMSLDTDAGVSKETHAGARTRKLRFASELTEGGNDSTALMPMRSQVSSARTSATSILLTRTLQELDGNSPPDEHEHDGADGTYGVDPTIAAYTGYLKGSSSARALPTAQPMTDEDRAAGNAQQPAGSLSRGTSGNFLTRMASRLGFSTAADRQGAAEASLRSELSLRDRYGAGSRSAAGSRAVSRMGSASVSRIPSISMMGDSFTTSIEDALDDIGDDHEEHRAVQSSPTHSHGLIAAHRGVSHSSLARVDISEVNQGMAAGETQGLGDSATSSTQSEAPSDEGVDAPSAQSSFTRDRLMSSALLQSGVVAPTATPTATHTAVASTGKAGGGIGRQRLPPTTHPEPHSPPHPTATQPMLGHAQASALEAGHAAGMKLGTHPGAAFTVRPAVNATLRVGRVRSTAASQKDMSQTAAAGLKPKSRRSSGSGIRTPTGGRPKKSRLLRGATLGAVITRVGLGSRRMSKEHANQLNNTNPGLMTRLGLRSQRSSKDHMGKPLSTDGSTAVQSSMQKPGALGSPGNAAVQSQQGQAATVRLHQQPSKQVASRPGLSRTSTARSIRTANRDSKAPRSRALPRMFSLKRDFWSLRAAAPMGSAK